MPQTYQQLEKEAAQNKHAAMTEIQRLEAEIARLRAALREILVGFEQGSDTADLLAYKIARKALDRDLPTAEDVCGILNERSTE